MQKNVQSLSYRKTTSVRVHRATGRSSSESLKGNEENATGTGQEPDRIGTRGTDDHRPTRKNAGTGNIA